MAESWFLMSFVAGIPLMAVVMVWASSTDISERHHSHHDTYTVASTFSWVVMFCMVFMGALGLLMAWMCSLNVYEADPLLVLAFFASFLGVAFLVWTGLRRYKVVTFDDRMCVTPVLGPVVTISYEDITAMVWESSPLVSRSRGVTVYVGQRRRARLLPVLDLDQILIRVDRFDVLKGVGA